MAARLQTSSARGNCDSLPWTLGSTTAALRVWTEAVSTRQAGMNTSFVWSWQTRGSVLAPPGQAGPKHTGVWGFWSG